MFYYRLGIIQMRFLFASRHCFSDRFLHQNALLFHLCALLAIQRTAILVRRECATAIRLPYLLSTISALLR